MMVLLINKEDISELITDVQNIDEKKINREINDTQMFDLRKQIPIELYNAFVALKELNLRSWSRSKNYVIGDKIIHDGIMYVAAADNDGSEPSSTNVNWTSKNLYTVFTNYIVPFLVFVSYSKYAVEHGLNAGHAGFQKVSEENNVPIDKSERALIVNKYQNRGDKYFMDFMNYISEANYIIDGVEYSFTCTNTKRISPKIKFKGV